jgi:translation initiation factor eIF-2B subunit gamma
MSWIGAIEWELQVGLPLCRSIQRSCSETPPDITLVTPPESENSLSAALAQNPHLTSLPSPTPDVLAPADLDHETGTAELLRLPEVQASIVGDFILLPCDLVCDVPGETFLETWMTSLGGFGGATDGSDLEVSGPKRIGLGGELGSRRGGLSVWYSTIDRDESVKGEECDFCATAKLDQEHDVPLSKNVPDSKASRAVLRKLVWAMPMSTLMDECEEDKDRSWHIRSSLLANYGSIKCLTKFRDAHIYLFPYWVKDFARLNEDFDSVSEDLVGTWAKMDWRKPGYRARYGAKELFGNKWNAVGNGVSDEVPIEEEIDLMSLSSTQVTRHASPKAQLSSPAVTLASRVTPDTDDSTLTPIQTSPSEDDVRVPMIPPILSYLQSTDPSSPLIRRVDSTPLFLSVSLLLAKVPAVDEFTSSTSTSISPFAHPSRIATTATIAARTTIARSDTLIGDNATISEKCVIKESVIGPSVSVGSGSRLNRCVIMDGAVIDERCTLTECVVGKKAKVGKGSVLQKCEVQDGNAVPDGTEGKDEKFLLGGLEDELDDEELGVDTGENDGPEAVETG